jgi:hypothetical protein
MVVALYVLGCFKFATIWCPRVHRLIFIIQYFSQGQICGALTIAREVQSIYIYFLEFLTRRSGCCVQTHSHSHLQLENLNPSTAATAATLTVR